MPRNPIEVRRNYYNNGSKMPHHAPFREKDGVVVGPPKSHKRAGWNHMRGMRDGPV